VYATIKFINLRKALTILSLFSVVFAVDDYTGKGCFEEQGGEPIIPFELFNNVSLTPLYCWAACIVGARSVMGLKGGVYCHCGANLPDPLLKTLDSYCNSPCPVPPPVPLTWPPHCGGIGYVYVYQINYLIPSKSDESTEANKPVLPHWAYGIMAFMGLLVMGMIAEIIFAVRKRSDIVVNVDAIEEEEEEMSEIENSEKDN